MKKLTVKSFLIKICVAIVVISVVTIICLGMRMTGNIQKDDKCVNEVVNIAKAISSDISVNVADGEKKFAKLNRVFSPLSSCEQITGIESFEVIENNVLKYTFVLDDSTSISLTTIDNESYYSNVLSANEIDYSFENMGICAFGIVDLNKSDNLKEIFVVEHSNWGMSTRIFRYINSGIVELGILPGGHCETLGADVFSEDGEMVKYLPPIMYDGLGKIASSVQQFSWIEMDYLISVYELNELGELVLLPVHWQSELMGKSVVLDEDIFCYKVDESVLLEELNNSPTGNSYCSLALLEPVKLSVGDVLTIDSFIYSSSETDISKSPWVIEVSSDELGEYVYLSLYSE